jgi:hypothetical protein
MGEFQTILPLLPIFGAICSISHFSGILAEPRIVWANVYLFFKKAVENRLCLPIIEYRDTMPTPEALARLNINRQLSACGWSIQDMSGLNRYASLGVVVRVRGEVMMAVT